MSRIGGQELRREFAVWRETRADDGQGGYDEVVAQVGTVMAKVNQPTADEVVTAQQSGVTLLYRLHMMPDADVQRGDELRGDGEVYRVTSTYVPSDPEYLLANCERRQAEV